MLEIRSNESNDISGMRESNILDRECEVINVERNSSLRDI